MRDLIYYYADFGLFFFFVFFFLPLLVYVLGKVFYLLFQYFLRQDEDAIGKLRAFIISASLFFSSSLVVLLILGAGLVFVTHSADPAHIAMNNDALMLLDKQIFGVYIPFWLHSPSSPFVDSVRVISPLLIVLYLQLDTMIGILLLLLLYKSGLEFFRACAALILAVAVGLLFWFLFPALSPLDGYVYPMVPVIERNDISEALREFQPAPAIQAFGVSVAAGERAYGDDFFPITTMPSMHIAWCFILLFFSLGKPLWRMVMIPFFLLTSLSTVVTLQHYAVDILAGIVVASVVLYIAFRAVRTPPRMISALSDALRADCKLLSRVFF